MIDFGKYVDTIKKIIKIKSKYCLKCIRWVIMNSGKSLLDSNEIGHKSSILEPFINDYYKELGLYSAFKSSLAQLLLRTSLGCTPVTMLESVSRNLLSRQINLKNIYKGEFFKEYH